jgi:S-disulfanyl-L-cysteine oxidoreductase SoxD
MLGGNVIGKSRQLARRYRGDARSATCRRCVIGLTVALTALLGAMQIAAMPHADAPARHPLAPGSVWDSVFTLAQAGRGESTFRTTCAQCHGDSLSGIDDAPPLAGPAFGKSWDGNSLGALFSRISNDMPSDNPGTLTKPQVAELVAFVLRYNAYPAGKADLPAAPESLTAIKFAPKP